MKKNYLLVATLFLMVNVAYAQSNVILSGGWVTASPDDSDTSVDGFKVGGQFERVVGDNKGAVGLEISYLGFKETRDLATTKFHAWPIDVYGKYFLGKSKLQGYLKGLAGVQFFTAKAEGTTNGGDATTKDFGFSVGAGAGANFNVNEKLFLNVDYEFLYLTNSFYNNGITNAVTLGLGFKIN